MNRNIGCIETTFTMSNILVHAEMNRNIGCIETVVEIAVVDNEAG